MATVTSERAITKQITEYLRCIGAWHVKIHVSTFQAAGTPDILACIGGRFCAFEVKRPGKKPTKLQYRRLEDIRQAGGIAGVVTSVEDVACLLSGENH